MYVYGGHDNNQVFDDLWVLNNPEYTWTFLAEVFFKFYFILKKIYFEMKC